MNLREKLLQVYAAIDHVEKSGHNKAFNYDYVRAADVVRTVRSELLRLKVYAEINYDFVGDPYTIAREKSPSAPFSAVNVKCFVTFRDAESEEISKGSAVGTGADTGDKAAYKAMTGSLKYALKNACLAPDEADPEADESVDEPEDKPSARQQSRNDPAPSFRDAQRNTGAKPVQPPKAEIPTEMPKAAAPAAPPPEAPKASSADRVPTEAELDDFRKNFSKLGDELASRAGMKASRGKPINRKIIVYLLQLTGAKDPKSVTFMQWTNFFAKVNTLRLNDEGIKALAELIEAANKQGE
jgi:ERF superfamily